LNQVIIENLFLRDEQCNSYKKEILIIEFPALVKNTEFCAVEQGKQWIKDDLKDLLKFNSTSILYVQIQILL
jgi:hypothetical protein